MSKFRDRPCRTAGKKGGRDGKVRSSVVWTLFKSGVGELRWPTVKPFGENGDFVRYRLLPEWSCETKICVTCAAKRMAKSFVWGGRAFPKFIGYFFIG
jgi:hypothetical protein